MTTPTPDRTTQPPAVPDELLVQWINEATAEEATAESRFGPALARRLTAWTWAQREEEVQEARRQGEAMADAELEACCQWLRDQPGCHGLATMLRATRRPAPPTLREQALARLNSAWKGRTSQGGLMLDTFDVALIRGALQEGADG